MCNKTFSRISVAAIGAVAAVGALATAGHAATFLESFDAGKTLGTALDVGIVGTGQLTQFIDGNFAASSDVMLFNAGFDPSNIPIATDSDKVDLFKIELASDRVLTAKALNPQNILHLFDVTGRYLNVSNSNPSGSLLTSSPLSAGIYYLGITQFRIRALLDDNQVLTGWSTAPHTQPMTNYRIELGDAHNQVPTPALLPGLFALGAGAWRKRKQRLAGAIA
jgi:hypothetical protein